MKKELLPSTDYAELQQQQLRLLAKVTNQDGLIYAAAMSVASHNKKLLKDNLLVRMNEIKSTVNIFSQDNDIYIDDRKVAGILIQNSLSGSMVKNAVLGIGININQEIFLADAPNPTSLKLQVGEEFNIEELIRKLSKYIETWYLKLKADQKQYIIDTYLNSLYRFNEVHEYKLVETNEIFKGEISGQCYH